MSEWTEEQIADLKRLAAEAQSGGQIAAVLGKTRSAVIGKATRLNLDLHGQRLSFFIGGRLHELEKLYFSAKGLSRRELCEHFNCTDSDLQTGINKLRKRNGMVRQRPVKIAEAPIKLRPVTSAGVSNNPVKLLAFQPHHCRYPLGDPLDRAELFCGDDNLGLHSYCPHHRGVASSPGRSYPPQVVS